MFRTRYEELCHLIELNKNLNPSSMRNQITNLPDSITPHIENVAKAFENEIKSFSLKMMESMFETKLVDYEFIDCVYEFDRNMFEMVLQTTIDNTYDTIGFQISMLIVRGFKYFLQAIIGYEAILKKLQIDISKHRMKSVKLMKGLEEMVAMEEFSQLSEDPRQRVEKMIDYLKMSMKSVPKSDETGSKTSKKEEAETIYPFLSISRK
ncbi:uncharacterized protein LOC129908765 [Episyrphus balteatus]|uniref:uncharacterized protein LOC129908765 n=1 Tax=Episyrphus balteatus TaxID=286459 RepID=UPI002485218E|nr:uncharacterized protein LOC129908765 [Episyrphus balteatus]